MKVVFLTDEERIEWVFLRCEWGLKKSFDHHSAGEPCNGCNDSVGNHYQLDLTIYALIAAVIYYSICPLVN